MELLALIVVVKALVLAKARPPWVVEALPKVRLPFLSKVALILVPSETLKALPVPELAIARTAPEALA